MTFLLVAAASAFMTPWKNPGVPTCPSRLAGALCVPAGLSGVYAPPEPETQALFVLAPPEPQIEEAAKPAPKDRAPGAFQRLDLNSPLYDSSRVRGMASNPNRPSLRLVTKPFEMPTQRVELDGAFGVARSALARSTPALNSVAASGYGFANAALRYEGSARLRTQHNFGLLNARAEANWNLQSGGDPRASGVLSGEIAHVPLRPTLGLRFVRNSDPAFSLASTVEAPYESWKPRLRTEVATTSDARVFAFSPEIGYLLSPSSRVRIEGHFFAGNAAALIFGSYLESSNVSIGWNYEI